MSTGKPPPNPFGSGDRTIIIRPNPGGRRPADPAPQPQQPNYPADVWSTGERASQPLYNAPASPSPLPEASAPLLPEDIKPVSAAELGLANPPEVTDSNPVMRSARPLLVLLANLRLSADHARVVPMMDEIAREIVHFERELAPSGLSETQIRSAKYAICATTDDIVQNLPGSNRLLWTQYSMLSRFFGATTSGVGFFDELNRAKAHPTINYNILELMYACLLLGFEGQFRAASGGEIHLRQIRQDLYQTLRTFKPPPPEDISPHWKGQDIKPAYLRFRIPVWAAASVAAFLLLGVFIALRILLGQSSEAAASLLIGLHPKDEILLARTHYEPLKIESVVPPESTQLQRIRARLKDDIAAKKVAVDAVKSNIRVLLLNDVVFDAGSADVKPGFEEVLARVAAALNPEPKSISIVGHTDSTKLKSRLKFKDNQQLSEKRAEAVAKIMRPKLDDSTRIVTSGRGEFEPIADNATPEGRAKNRRVVVLLPRTDP